jgi:transcriptional regulator of arginine metabolism
MTRKETRHAAIRELVSARQIGSQEEFKRLLAERGVQVTQATLSRDLRELGIVRAPGDGGPRYALPEDLTDADVPSLEVLLPQFFSHIDGVSELAVLHTLPGGAQPIAEALDAKGWGEILGTIGGENTILIVCRSGDARLALVDRLTALAQG